MSWSYTLPKTETKKTRLPSLLGSGRNVFMGPVVSRTGSRLPFSNKPPFSRIAQMQLAAPPRSEEKRKYLPSAVQHPSQSLLGAELHSGSRGWRLEPSDNNSQSELWPGSG